MKHSQYKELILSDSALNSDQQKALEQHISTCKECRQLRNTWMSCQKTLTHVKMAAPAPGFTRRWEETLARKIRLETVRQHRLTVAGLVLVGFIASLIYLIASGSLMHVLANSFTSIVQFMIAISQGLATVGYWLKRLPIAVPLVTGFVLFGLLTAFLMTTVFTLWNINNRKKIAHETTRH